MKVLMTTDTIGGVWTYSLELCKALSEKGVKIHLAAMGLWPSKEQEEEVSALKNVILYKSDFKLEWMQDPWEDVEKARKWINCIYHTIHPDLVHFNNYGHPSKDWTCPTLTVFHSCVKTWWQAVKGTEAPDSWDKYSKKVLDALNTSDVVVAPTHAILEKAIETHGFSSETRVIHNGRDYVPHNDKNLVTSKGMFKKENIIFAIGRVWDEAKNLEILTSIAKNLPWKIYIAGDHQNPSTGKKVEMENIEFLGKLKPAEVQEWMQRASIFVSPSKYEPFGLAVLEAAKAECALVLSDLKTLRELWKDEASFFHPESTSEVTKRILQLIDNPDLRNEMAKKAHLKSEFYTREKMGREYFELYLETIENKTQPKLKSA